MVPRLSPDVLSDNIAVSLACVVAVANKRADALGIDIETSLISITQHFRSDQLLWRVNYGPKDYVGRRGGDLVIEVDPSDASIKQVLWGQ